MHYKSQKVYKILSQNLCLFCYVCNVTVHGSVCSFWCLSSLCGSVRCLVTAAGSVIRVLSCSSFALPLSSWRCIVCCRFVNFVLFLCQLSCSLSGQFGLFFLLHWIYLHCLDSHHCGCESLFRLEFPLLSSLSLSLINSFALALGSCDYLL